MVCLSRTKIFMAGMRLFGFQSKKPGPVSQIRLDADLAVDDEAEDEHKLVYHQTYKAASFTFRKYFGIQVIEQEVMREVMDKFLTIFCSDLLALANVQDGDTLGFSSQNSNYRSTLNRISSKNTSPAQPTT